MKKTMKLNKLKNLQFRLNQEIRKEYQIILLILAIGSIIIGYLLLDYFTSNNLLIFHNINNKNIQYQELNINYSTILKEYYWGLENRITQINNEIKLSLPIILIILLTLYYIIKILLYNILNIQNNNKIISNIYKIFRVLEEFSFIKFWINFWSLNNKFLFIIFNRRIFIDSFINIISNKILHFFYYYLKTFDFGIIEIFTPNLKWITFSTQFNNSLLNKYNSRLKSRESENIGILGDLFIYLFLSISFLFLLFFLF